MEGRAKPLTLRRVAVLGNPPQNATDNGASRTRGEQQWSEHRVLKLLNSDRRPPARHHYRPRTPHGRLKRTESTGCFWGFRGLHCFPKSFFPRKISSVSVSKPRMSRLGTEFGYSVLPRLAVFDELKKKLYLVLKCLKKCNINENSRLSAANPRAERFFKRVNLAVMNNHKSRTKTNLTGDTLILLMYLPQKSFFFFKILMIKLFTY